MLMPGPDRQSGCCADAQRRMLRPGSPLSSLFRREGRAVGREGTWLGVRASRREEFGAGALRLTPAGRCAPPLRSGARPLVPLGKHSGFALIFSLVRKRAGEEKKRGAFRTGTRAHARCARTSASLKRYAKCQPFADGGVSSAPLQSRCNGREQAEPGQD